jgi:hypothetical protein
MFPSANGATNGQVLQMERDNNEILEKMSEYQKWVVQQKILYSPVP